MGKSGRWLLGLIGVKKTSKSSQNDSSSPSESGKHDSKKTQREKRRWSFGRPSQNHSLDDMSKSHCPEKGLEQEHAEHTLAIAATSAAEAAVAVAHSAAAAAQVTASYHETAENGEWAAIRIQTAFRGYLARRALRALKGLVRLQALFRGHRVRKQAALTLRCMQALVRVQARVRARRVRMSEEGKAVQEQLLSRRRQQPARSRKSMEGWNASTCTVENLKAKAEQRQLGAIKRERALAYAFSQQVRKSTPKEGSLFIDCEAETPHWGWSWLERWMAARPWESPLMEKVDFEDSPVGKSSAGSTKIVEMDFTKLRQRKNKSQSHELLSAELDMVSRPTIQPWPSTPAGDSESAAPYSRAESPHKAAMATPDLSHPRPVSCNRSDLVKQKKGMQDGGFTSLNNEDMPDEDECGFTTAISSPRLSTTGPKSGMNFVNSGSAKGEQTGDNIQPDDACPSFMASTQSAKAKFRSQSTPKQRPEPSEKSIHDAKKRQSLPVSDRKLASAASLSQKTLLQYHLNSTKAFTGSVALDRSFMSLTDGQYTMSVNGDAHGRYKF